MAVKSKGRARRVRIKPPEWAQVRITSPLLKRAEACPKQLRRFGIVFPTGTRITKTALVKAARADLTVYWIPLFWRRLFKSTVFPSYRYDRRLGSADCGSHTRKYESWRRSHSIRGANTHAYAIWSLLDDHEKKQLKKKTTRRRAA